MSGDIRDVREKKRKIKENREKDKKFLYHKITLSSPDVIFYVPIYALRRIRRKGRRGSRIFSRRVSKGDEEEGMRTLRYKMKEAHVEGGCSMAEIEVVSCSRHSLTYEV